MKKSQGDINPLTDGLKRASPLVVFGLVYCVLALLMNLSYKVWIPVALGAALAEAIIVLGRFYRPFLIDEKGKCVAGRDSRKTRSMESCRHYLQGGHAGGCGRRAENGFCRARMR